MPIRGRTLGIAFGALAALQGLHPPRDGVNSAWRMDAATADRVPVPVARLACGRSRRF